MSVELVILVILVVGIVLVGMGLMGRVGRSAGDIRRYAGSMSRDFYGRARRYLTGNFQKYLRGDTQEYFLPVQFFSPTGESIELTRKEIRYKPRPREIAYEGFVVRGLPAHGQDIKVEPEVGLLIEATDYALRNVGIAEGGESRTIVDVIKGWIDRRKRRPFYQLQFEIEPYQTRFRPVRRRRE